jgi:hypothetical protein
LSLFCSILVLHKEVIADDAIECPMRYMKCCGRVRFTLYNREG